MDLQFVFGNPTKKRGVAKHQKDRKNKHKGKLIMRKIKKNPTAIIAQKKGTKKKFMFKTPMWSQKEGTVKQARGQYRHIRGVLNKHKQDLAKINEALKKTKNAKRRAALFATAKKVAADLKDSLGLLNKIGNVRKSRILSTKAAKAKMSQLSAKGYSFRKVKIGEKKAEELLNQQKDIDMKKNTNSQNAAKKAAAKKAAAKKAAAKKAAAKKAAAKKAAAKKAAAKKTANKKNKKVAKKKTRKAKKSGNYSFKMKVSKNMKRNISVMKKYKKGKRRFIDIIARTNPVNKGAGMIGKIGNYSEMILLNSGEELIGSGIGAVVTAVITKNKMAADVTTNIIAKAEAIHPAVGVVSRILAPRILPLLIAHGLKLTKNRHAIAASKAIATVQVFAMAQQAVVEAGKPFGLAAIPDMSGVDFTVNGVDFTAMSAIPDMRGADFGRNADFGASDFKSAAGQLKSKADFGAVDFTMNGAHDMDSDAQADSDEDTGETGDHVG
jgi:hypothetical protein